MARIDKGLVTLVGRDRENPRTHRDAFQITGGLGEVLDKHIKRNNLNKSEFIREAIAAKLEAEMQKEPLIKDERIRKVVRLCADIWEADKILAIKLGSRIEFSDGILNMRYVSFMYAEWQDEIEDRTYYTIEELCGEEEE